MNEIERIRESSQYLATLLRRRQDLAAWLETGMGLQRRFPLTELYQNLQHASHRADSFGSLLSIFREFKQRHFLRIGGRDLTGLAGLAETTAQLSDLAAVSLQVGLDMLYLHPDWWLDDEGRALWKEASGKSRLVVLGMGKLGGHELNYVSDVDLIFLHGPSGRNTVQGPETGMLLSRLCQWLSRLLSDSAQGDRVFLVDLRLRPQGKDGPLVTSAAAAADYYLNHGRAWERQMLLKARPVAGDRSLGNAFLKEVRPFVFRRFLDFQALDELRAMRDKILSEAVRPTIGWKQFDVKLGIGGIREIEFLVQSFQLIYGGRHPELDEPGTLRCLDRLEVLRLLPPPTVKELKDCYTFLRGAEHWVQLDQNRHTQKLPQSEEALARLSLALGFGGKQGDLFQRLELCCNMVHRHFLDLFQPAGETSTGPGNERSGEHFRTSGGGAEDFSTSSSSFPPEALSRLGSLLEAFSPRLRGRVAETLDQYRLTGPELSERVILRLERYFNQVRKRPGLVRLFHSAPPWVIDLCHGLVRSELISALLAQNPSLVEGLTTKSADCLPDDAWEASCRRLLRRARDFEEGLEWLRRLKNERLLQLVLADLRGDLDARELEGRLTNLADLVIRNTYDRIRANLELTEGLPLSVLALGKLGSREMGYLSDLDLIFVYDPLPGEPEEHIPSDVIRLIQRFMRMLSTPLQEGPGYAVDARLRPTGNYGPLIVTRRNWLEYYTQSADLWEIQALLRIRSIAGNRKLGQWIEAAGREICYVPRPPAEVRQRLCHLRRRMENERAEEREDAIDLKLGMGGLADIEFLVQGQQLIEGHRDSKMQHSSVRHSLGHVLAGTPDLRGQASEIQAAFEALRVLEHRLRLHTNQPSSRITPLHFETMQAIGLWPPASGKSPIETWHDVLRLRRRIRNAFHRFCPEP